MLSSGVEGTGTHGAGIARFLAGQGVLVHEVNRPDRSTRRLLGKSGSTPNLRGLADNHPEP